MNNYFYDINLIKNESLTFKLENGILKDMFTSDIDEYGIRYYYNNSCGYVSSNNISCINENIKKAKKIAETTNKYSHLSHNFCSNEEKTNKNISPVPKIKEDPFEIPIEEKISLLKEIDNFILEKQIKTRSQSYFESKTTHEYRDSNGNVYEYTLTRIGYSINCIAKNGVSMQVGNKYKYEISGYEFFKKNDLFSLALESVNSSTELLNSKTLKSNFYPVILDQQLAGVFTHEAFGHSSEADLCIKGDSMLSDYLSKSISSSEVTVIDDPTNYNYGFYPFDHDGCKGKKNILIDKGIYNSFMHSKETSIEMNSELGCNSRAQGGSYPQVRMSNTYIENNNSSFEEMMNEMKNGIYLIGSRGGQVDTGSGIFQFNAEKGYLVENCSIKNVIRDISVSGSILDVLKNISLVGNDLKISSGYCGKGGQVVPVSDGAPHIYISKVAVGGA